MSAFKDYTPSADEAAPASTDTGGQAPAPASAAPAKDYPQHIEGRLHTLADQHVHLKVHKEDSDMPS